MHRCVSIASAARNAPVKRKYALLLGIGAVVVAVDQFTKQLALDNLLDGPISVVDGWVSLDLGFNPGGAFGLFRGSPGFFLVATIVVSLVLLVWVRQLEGRWELVPLGLVLGGGLGNLTDRLLRETPGVVDFIDVGSWPTFNIADAAISTGVVWLLILGARADRVPE